jgi:universal stress protein E
VRGLHGPTVAAFLERTEADVVVMGTASRSGIAGFLMGNTAEWILKTLRCSVLAVKPEGFRSPVGAADPPPLIMEVR